MKDSRSIEWLSEATVNWAIKMLAQEHPNDTIYVINDSPLCYVSGLRAVSEYYEDDILMLDAVVIRSIIKGHPLYDGNKRLGMFLGEICLHKNGCRLDVDNDEIVEIALRIADSSRNWGREEIYSWLVKSCVCRKHIRGSDEHK